MAKLIVSLSEDQRIEHELIDESTTIGRSKDNDLMIPESSVSGRHARIVKTGGKFVFEDIGSTNGSFLNGSQIKTAPLDDGDEVMLGLVECHFVADAPEEAGVLPKPPHELPKAPRFPAPQPA